MAWLMAGAGAVSAQPNGPAPDSPAGRAVDCPTLGSATRSWASTGGQDHPLVGTAISAGTGASLPLAAFADTLAAALPPAGRFILLGEVHDNPDHHALRARLIRELACRATAPKAAVFEHIRADQQSALDRFAGPGATAQPPGTGTDLMRLLDWDNSGWPAARMFLPLLDAVLGAGLTILPGDPARSTVRALARGEAGAVAADVRARLRLDEPLPQPLADALAIELKDSHCGMLPETAIPALALAQRYRDAHQADAMLAASATYGVTLLLAGNGHVRADRAVPWHIRQRAPAAGIVTVSYVEVEDGRTDPLAYLPRAPDGTAAVDYIVFTPRAARPDPCEMMRPRKSGRG